MNKDIISNWEKEFDEKYSDLVEEVFNTDWIEKREQKWVYVDRSKELKSFIKSLLSQQQADLIEKVEKLTECDCCKWDDMRFTCEPNCQSKRSEEYKNVLSDVLQLLKGE